MLRQTGLIEDRMEDIVHATNENIRRILGEVTPGNTQCRLAWGPCRRVESSAASVAEARLHVACTVNAGIRDDYAD